MNLSKGKYPKFGGSNGANGINNKSIAIKGFREIIFSNHSVSKRES